MNSLRGRLSVRLLVSLIAVFGLQWLAVSYSIHQVTENYVISRLEHDADGLLAAIALSPEGKAELANVAISSIYHVPYSGHYYLITGTTSSIASRSLWDQELQIEPLSAGERRRFRAAGPESQILLVLQQAYKKQDHTVNIVVAEDMSAVEADIHTFQMRYAGLSLLFMVLLMGLQMFGIRKALLPLQHSRGQVDALLQGRLERMDENVPDEIRPLMQEINHLLALSNRRLAHSRTAIGNLAHALKTPLTVLRQFSTQEDLSADSRALLDNQIDSMQRMLDRELKLARLAGSGPSNNGFKPEEDLQGLLEVLKRIYPHIEIQIEHLDESESRVAFDREDMLECLGNLLDNACKWAKLQVRVQVDTTQGLSVLIEDDGPGCSEDALKQLGTRGLRLDESVTGHGLGLSICRDIVSHYQGRLEFGQSTELKGLRVLLELPLNRIDDQSNRPSTDR